MPYKIKNDELTVSILGKGAELCSVRDNHISKEYIWQAGEEWPRHAPILFPIVGSLLDHEYYYEKQKYALKHHGFARDKTFDVLQQSEHSIAFVLAEDEETLEAYPFQFRLLITYSLEGRELTQKFRVINMEKKPMPVSYGAHPAFNANPIEDFKIEFSEDEYAEALKMEVPYVSNVKRTVFEGHTLSLDNRTFDQDALIFRNLKSGRIDLSNSDGSTSIGLNFNKWPYLGIWSKPGAGFVCLEPWEGIADFTKHDKQIENKEGIRWIQSEGEHKSEFSITFYK